MESIEVRYTPLGDGSYYHKYLVYTDSNGNQSAVRGGPTKGPSDITGTNGEIPGLTTAESPGNGAWWSPFGSIVIQEGPYDPTFLDYDPTGTNPSEIVKTGDDLSADWEKIKDAMNDIENEQHPYSPVTSNSNSTIDEALRRSDIPEPENDDIGENWSPGSGNVLDPRNLKDKFEDALNDTWEQAKAALAARRDPLIFDLDGDGLETSGIADTNPVLFDHDGDGVKNGTGWVDADDAFLVLDKNGNGTIDNGLELFGDSTIKSDGTTAADGFDALADLDSNADGIVNADDTQFANLRLWRDLNQDGISQSNELFTLDSQDVVGINVASTEHSQVLANGNQLADTGTFIKSDGSAGTVGEVVGDLGDVDLASDTFHREFTDTLDTTAVANLPDMQGSGAIRDLREAATQSSRLESLLTQFSAATTHAGQVALIDQLLDAWADTSGFAERYQDRIAGESYTDANGFEVPYAVRYLAFGDVRREYEVETTAGTEILVQNTYHGGGFEEVMDDNDNDYLTDRYSQLIAEWDQKIHIIEAFNGSYFFGSPESPTDGAATGLSFTDIAETNGGGGSWTASPYRRVGLAYTELQLDLLQQSYDAIKTSVYQALALQTRFKPLLDQIGLIVDGSGLSLDFTQLNATFDAKVSANATEGLLELIDFNAATNNMLSGTSWNGWQRVTELVADSELSDEVVESLQLNGILSSIRRWTNTIGDDVIIGNASVDFIKANSGDDTVLGLGGNDVLLGGLGDDTIDGGDGNDSIRGNAGTDTIFGGAGDDKLYANDTSSYGRNNNTDTADILEGGTGTDTIWGSTGANTYIYNLGDGTDTIYANGQATSSTEALDTLVLGVGITAADVSLTKLSNNLLISFTNAGDQIVINNWYQANHSYRLASIVFADGTVWGAAEFSTISGTSGNDYITGTVDSDVINGLAGNDTLTGNAGDDTIDGGDGNDSIRGNAGTDTIFGGAGDDKLYANDTSSYGRNNNTDTADILEGGTGTDTIWGSTGANTYIYNLGDGTDTIYANGQATSSTEALDTLVLGVGITAADVSLTKLSNNLLISFTNAGDQIVINNWYQANHSYRLASIVFADGTVWGAAEFSTISGTSGNDYITGTVDSDVINGLAGNDTLTGNAGDDTIDGGDGNDSIRGNAGTDTIFGGAGDDKLYANDTSSYGRNNNTDTADILEGGTGTDTIWGSTGANTYIYNLGDGTDTIYANGQATSSTEALDTLVLGVGITAADVSLTKLSNNLLISFTNAGDQIVINNWYQANHSYRLASIVFADGTVWGAAEFSTISGTSGNDYITGTVDSDVINGLAGNDTLTGNAGDDTIDGGDGNDSIRGNAGTDTIFGGAGDDKLYANDTSSYGRNNNTDTADILEGGTGTDTIWGSTGANTYIYNLGDGTDTIYANGQATSSTEALDTLVLGVGITAADVSLTKLSNNLLISFTNAGDQIVINNWYQANHSYRLASIVFADGTVWGAAEFSTISGTSGNDYITGTVDSDVINGLAGNDTLTGNAGDDTIDGGDGNDSIRGNAGTDTIFGGAGDDKLYAYSSGSSASSHADADILEGGKGADLLYGDGGSDTYRFNIGDGADTIYETVKSGETSTDKVLLGAGIAASDVTLTRSGSNLLIKFATAGDQITVSNYYYSGNTNYQIEAIEFADGTVWDGATIYQNGLVMEGTAASETLYGLNHTNDTILGLGGNDNLYGKSGADVLLGGEGNDKLYAYSSGSSASSHADADILEGGKGADLLYGDGGSDTYRFNIGDGADTIYETVKSGETSTDKVLLGAGIAASDVTLTRSGSNLLIKFATAGDQITVSNYYYSGNTNYQIEAIEFADGTVWDGATIYQNGLVMEGTAASETLYGLNHTNDTILGLGGNDNLYGKSGADVLLGGEGNDKLYAYSSGSSASSHADADILEGGKGADLLYGDGGSDLFIGGEGNDIITTNTGYDIIAFNKGDGQDTVYASTGADNTLSLGGNFAYSDLSLTKFGNDLAVNIGGADRITLQGWYVSTGNHSITNLQVIAEAIQGFELGSTNTLLDNKVENFDFASLVAQFDAEGASNNWQLTDARLTAHLQAGSNSAAIGGDITYQYGLNGSLTGMGVNHAQSTIGNASFGQGAQALNDPNVWQAEAVKLG